MTGLRPQLCAICDCRISLGLLMCGLHWRLVPAAEQLDVLRTYGRWARHTGPELERQGLKADYIRARDKAVATVNAALAMTDLSGE